MNTRTFTYVFFGLGILLAILSIYLSLEPLGNPIKHGYQIYKPFGIIVMGFLSGVCLFVSGMLVRKSAD